MVVVVVVIVVVVIVEVEKDVTGRLASYISVVESKPKTIKRK